MVQESAVGRTSQGKRTLSRGKRTSWWRKLVLVLWKNLLLRKRHWVLTLFEVLLPTLLFTLVVVIRIFPDSVFRPYYVNTTSEFSPLNESGLKKEMCSNYGQWMFGYCVVVLPGNFTRGQRRIFWGPPNNFTLEVMGTLKKELRFHKEDFVSVSTNAEMDSRVESSYFEANDSYSAFYMGVFFHLSNPDDPDPPDVLNYDIRMQKTWFTNYLYPYLQIPGPRLYEAPWMGSYNMDGFTLVQHIIDRKYTSMVADDESIYQTQKLETQMYPYPEYVQDSGMSQMYGSFLPTFVVLSLVLLSPSLIKSIVHEKETGVKELMQLMGLDAWTLRIGWFLHSFFMILIIASIATFLLKTELAPSDIPGSLLPPIIIHTNGFILWLFLVVYGISSIAFCFAISSLFSRPTLATTLGILLWLVSYYVPNAIMNFKYETLDLAPKVASCLLPNMAITWAFKVISMFEGRVVGLQWDNLWETGNPRDQLTPGLILIMLLVDAVLFTIITWYVDLVRPGQYGVPLPFYFPFQYTYWFGVKPADAENLPERSTSTQNPDYFEEEPKGLKPGIIIRNLRKVFKNFSGSVKVAVESVDMTCYEGQCSVLLGHNGAGKTTTMSVLTGVYAPTSGYAEVGGWNISTHLKEARTLLGLCPQHNMLFNDLTVMEHLLFFGRLKGLTTKEARAEAYDLLERLQLTFKRNQRGSQLSGGMKRKLSLAIALIGGSKVVILDEPSSGLDPESRRGLWNVIQGERGRRTLLVTTHHMEEADVLGDKIAIMADGKVICSGSTVFLKNKFGDGYSLTLTVPKEDCDVRKISSLVWSHLPDAALRTAVGGEITYKLPPCTAKFAPMLEELTLKRQELNIQHVGLSLTSMEQVFLRVGELADHNHGRSAWRVQGNSGALQTPEAEGGIATSDTRTLLSSDSLSSSSKETLANGLTESLKNGELPSLHNGYLNSSGSSSNPYSSTRFLFNSQTNVVGYNTGFTLLRQRFRALFTKRMIYSKRKWLLLVTQGILPILITIMSLMVDTFFDETTFQEPPRLLNISMFKQSTNSFVEVEGDIPGIAENYMDVFWSRHKVKTTSDITEALLDEGRKNMFVYRENDITSALFSKEKEELTGRMLYQSIPFHTPGVGMNILSNAFHRYATGSTTNDIITTNRPLPPDRTWIIDNDRASGSSIVYSMMMPVALAFLSASFLVFPLQERVIKSKQLQLMTGTPAWALWMTTYMWDLLAYLVTAVLLLIFFPIMDVKNNFTVDGALGVLFLLLFLYGWASVPMAYLFSFPFSTAASGFAILAMFNIIFGMIISTATWALNISEEPTLITVSNVLDQIGRIVPSYPASKAFLHLVNTSHSNRKCDLIANATVKEELCKTLAQQAQLPFFKPNKFLTCCPRQCHDIEGVKCFEKLGYLTWEVPGMGKDVTSLFIDGIIFFVILALIEAGIGNRIRELFTTKSRQVSSHRILDDDVLREAHEVAEEVAEKSNKSALLVKNLTKKFSSMAIPAVDQVSFRVHRGECFGLLGVNGAGKTTTFRMLTGDESLTSGNAFINGVPLAGRENKFVRQIGYCPQFDAILGELTGVETLFLMGRLRGVPEHSLPHVVQDMVSLVGIEECQKRPVSTYSGGNKRKLSTAIALVGFPPLVFLDEPTSGVDPTSRRRLWSALAKVRSSGQSLLLTSHSMEECEALCNRLVIMSQGALQCCGTTQHLKMKYGQGYSLQIKVRSFDDVEDERRNVEELKKAIREQLPGSVVTDEHRGMIAYQIPNTTSWATLFKVMEDLKTGSIKSREGDILVEDYAASDTSLEQIFLSFAREPSIQIENFVTRF